MRALLLASATAILAASPAAAQTVQNDPFQPRIYGNINAATSVITEAAPTQIYAVPASNTVTRIVEPVQPGASAIINAPIVYDENGVMKAQHFKAGDLTDAQYQALLAEADRVRGYQTYTAPIDTSPITYESADTTITYGGTDYAPAQSSTYEIELFEAAPTAQTITFAEIAPIATSAHTVMKGDTLYNISKRYNVSISSIQDENGLSGTGLGLGQVIKIPAGALSRDIQAINTSAQQPIFASAPMRDGYVTRRIVEPVSNSAPAAAAISGKVYRVLPKDTLYSISRRSCVKVADLISVNGLSNPNALAPGQALSMPNGHCLKN